MSVQSEINRISTLVDNQTNYISQIITHLATIVGAELEEVTNDGVVSPLATNTENLSLILQIVQSMAESGVYATQAWVTENYQKKIENGASLPTENMEDGDIYLIDN